MKTKTEEEEKVKKLFFIYFKTKKKAQNGNNLKNCKRLKVEPSKMPDNKQKP